MSKTTHLLHGNHPRAWCLCGVNFDFSTRYEQYQDHLYFVREQRTTEMNYNHTPDTNEVRQHWTDIGFGGDGPSFDRWHQEELRQAKEQAWGEGTEAVALLIPEHEWHDRGLRLPTNPYRSQP